MQKPNDLWFVAICTYERVVYLFIYLFGDEKQQFLCSFHRDSGIVNIAQSYLSSFFLRDLSWKHDFELDFAVYTFQTANGYFWFCRNLKYPVSLRTFILFICHTNINLVKTVILYSRLLSAGLRKTSLTDGLSAVSTAEDLLL